MLFCSTVSSCFEERKIMEPGEDVLNVRLCSVCVVVKSDFFKSWHVLRDFRLDVLRNTSLLCMHWPERKHNLNSVHRT